MNRPRLLDLFCGAGGAAKGYADAGFDVTGVDIKPQPRYPFAFVEGDALEYATEHGREYDAIHASPPCQGYSVMRNLPWLSGKDYPLLILPTRELLSAIGRPWVIENVEGARWGSRQLAKRGLEAHGMKAAWLCGAMFGLPVYRHRMFETSFFFLQPSHPRHQGVIKHGRGIGNRAAAPVFDDQAGRRRSLAAWQQGNGAQKHGVGVGHAAAWRDFAKAIGVEWMDRDGASQAVPPSFTCLIGSQLRIELAMEAVA